jgi:hypothetical protein
MEKDRLVVMIDSELKKEVQIYGINNKIKKMNITEVTETALREYLDRRKNDTE